MKHTTNLIEKAKQNLLACNDFTQEEKTALLRKIDYMQKAQRFNSAMCLPKRMFKLCTDLKYNFTIFKQAAHEEEHEHILV